ncbi:MAG: ArsR/SmtB family transcription factor [Candidatus Thorarchaeota archaeon]
MKVLSDPTRLGILEFLKNNPSTSIDIQKTLNISQSYTSHQLRKLIDANLIEFEKKNKIKYYKPRNNDIYKLLTIIHSYIFKIEKEKYEKFNLIGKIEPIKDFSEMF